MRYLVILVAVLLSFSCAQKKLVPLGNGVKVDAKTYTSVYEDDMVSIKVKANAWEGYPSDLPDYVLPLYLEIHNKSPEAIEIDLKDITLIDDRGNQLNALEPKDVAEAVRGSYGVGVAIGFTYGSPTWGHSLLLGGPPYHGYADEVINRAFIPGRILPGARLKGFVYFQRIPDEARRVSLRVGYRIGERRKEVVFKFEIREGGSDNGRKEDRYGDSQGPH